MRWTVQPLAPCTASVIGTQPGRLGTTSAGNGTKPGKNYSAENRRLPVAASIHPRTATSNLHPIPLSTSWALPPDGSSWRHNLSSIPRRYPSQIINNVIITDHRRCDRNRCCSSCGRDWYAFSSITHLLACPRRITDCGPARPQHTPHSSTTAGATVPSSGNSCDGASASKRAPRRTMPSRAPRPRSR